jgi:hypothetical protein
MNCEEIQAQLSDYLDRSLGAAPMALIEEHLVTCPPCRREAELLGESIRQVATLPVMEPPLGFTQRVMAQVRQTETPAGFWQRLFLPLQVKIPIQATALVMIGVLGIYLLQKEEPHKQLTPALDTTATDAVKQESAALTTSEATLLAKRSVEQSISPRKVESTAAPLVAQQSATRRKRTVAAENQAPVSTGGFPLASAPASPAAAPSASGLSLEGRASASPAAPEPKRRGAAVISGTPVASPAPGQSGSSSVSFSLPSEADSGAFRSAPTAIEPFADYELVLRRHGSGPAERPGEAGRAPQRLESTRTSADHPSTARAIDRLMAAIPDHSRPQTIWITVPKDQYEQFKKELQTLGTMESETRVPLLRDQAASQADGHIRVKLTALPAADKPSLNQPSPDYSR